MSLSVSGVIKRFGGVTAVDGVTFRAEPGEITGFLGANGAGKTTTLRMIASLLTPDAGTITLDGTPIVPSDHALRRRIGLLTEETGLFDRLTPRETLRFFADLNDVPRATTDARIARFGDELKLTEFLDRRCGELSKGNRQKVALARALIHDPELLLLDEPTAALDVVSAEGVADALRAAAADGRIVVLSTHIAEEAARLCARIVVIARGRIVADAATAELTAGRNLREALIALMEVP